MEGIKYLSLKPMDDKTLARIRYLNNAKIRGSHHLLKLTCCFADIRRTVCFEFPHVDGAYVDRDSMAEALARARSLLSELISDRSPDQCNWLKWTESPSDPSNQPVLDLHKFETTWRPFYPKEKPFESMKAATEWLASEERAEQLLLEEVKAERTEENDLPDELCTKSLRVVGCYIPFTMMPAPLPEDHDGASTPEEEAAKGLGSLYLPQPRDEIMEFMLKSPVKLFQVHYGRRKGDGWQCFKID